MRAWHGKHFRRGVFKSLSLLAPHKLRYCCHFRAKARLTHLQRYLLKASRASRNYRLSPVDGIIAHPSWPPACGSASEARKPVKY